MLKKLLIVGCGELGSRHLQAAASLKGIGEIHIIDSNEQALAIGKSRITEISDLNRDIKFFWWNSFKKEASNGDCCVVATLSKGRGALVKKIVNELNYRTFLIEKVVEQSLTEYQSLMDFCHQHKVNVWVNCKTRAYAIHEYVKSKLDPNIPVIFTRIDGNEGLGTNGIHAADLFCFYTGAKEIIPTGQRIDAVLHPSKRGKDIYDLSGSLCATTARGDDFFLSHAKDYNSADSISIMSSQGRFLVDHVKDFALESYPQDGWQWHALENKENRKVSHMSKVFIDDILRKSQCALPTLEQCFVAHQYICLQLQPHFNSLLKQNLDYCPIT